MYSISKNHSTERDSDICVRNSVHNIVDITSPTLHKTVLTKHAITSWDQIGVREKIYDVKKRNQGFFIHMQLFKIKTTEIHFSMYVVF
jgi:hypothetical protein